MSRPVVANSLGGFGQRIRSVDDRCDLIGVIWNEPWDRAAAPDEHSPTDIVDYGRLVVKEHGYTVPNVIGRVDLPEVLEWAPMWLLTDADGRVTGGFFAHSPSEMWTQHSTRCRSIISSLDWSSRSTT